VTHRTTPSEALRGVGGLWRYLITHGDPKAGPMMGPGHGHMDRLLNNARPELSAHYIAERKPASESAL
jgi:hypothetical protein